MGKRGLVSKAALRTGAPVSGWDEFNRRAAEYTKKAVQLARVQKAVAKKKMRENAK